MEFQLAWSHHRQPRRTAKDLHHVIYKTTSGRMYVVTLPPFNTKWFAKSVCIQCGKNPPEHVVSLNIRSVDLEFFSLCHDFCLIDHTCGATSCHIIQPNRQRMSAMIVIQSPAINNVSSLNGIELPQIRTYSSAATLSTTICGREVDKLAGVGRIRTCDQIDGTIVG